MVLTVFILYNMSNMILTKLVDKAIVLDYHNELVSSPLAHHAHSHARTFTCFAFLPTDFGGKERLLAVYSSLYTVYCTI